MVRLKRSLTALSLGVLTRLQQIATRLYVDFAITPLEMTQENFATIYNNECTIKKTPIEMEVRVAGDCVLSGKR